jgi:RNA polymerase sigma factor for flagellar operon FliA
VNARVVVRSDMTRDELTAVLLPFVSRTAAHLVRGLPSHVLSEDLQSAGKIGLIEAVDRFNPAQADKFIGFALLRIRGAMLDELRKSDVMSQHARQFSKRLERKISELRITLGRDASEEELAEAMGLSLGEYQSRLETVTDVRIVPLLDNDISEPRDQQHEDAITDADALSTLRDRLLEGMVQMPQREQLVLSLYYDKQLTMKEVAQVLEVSVARVCQLHAQAIHRLKTLCGARQREVENV